MTGKQKNILEILREIRDKQSERYFNNSELLKKDMEKIRKKYRLKPLRELAAV